MEVFELIPLRQEEVKVRGRPIGAVMQIREAHHTVARLYAAGHKPPEIGVMMNRTGATIRNWLASPAMAELVAQYARTHEAKITTELEYRAELRRRASTASLEALVSKIEADPDSVPTSVLVKLAADSDDRTGLGKQETRVNVNLDLGARLDQAKERTKGLEAARAEGNVVKFVRRF